MAHEISNAADKISDTAGDLSRCVSANKELRPSRKRSPHIADSVHESVGDSLAVEVIQETLEEGSGYAAACALSYILVQYISCSKQSQQAL